MADLFNIQLETDLSEFDSTVTDGGDLSQTTPGLASTVGKMACLIDDTNSIYGQKNQAAPAGNEIRFRFYIDPNALTMGSSESFYALYINASASPWQLCRVALRWNGSTFQLYHVAMNDGSSEGSTTKDIGDAEHYVEIHIERASSNVAADGRVRWWIDGALQDTWSNVDNYDLFNAMSNFRIGAVAGVDAGTSGTFYIDEIKANDDGGVIGAVSSSIAILRRRREGC